MLKLIKVRFDLNLSLSIFLSLIKTKLTKVIYQEVFYSTLNFMYFFNKLSSFSMFFNTLLKFFK